MSGVPVWKCANETCAIEQASVQCPIGWFPDVARMEWQRRESLLFCSPECIVAFYATQPPPAEPE